MESSARSRLPFSSSDSLQADTSDRYNEIRSSIISCISEGKSTSELEHRETRNSPVDHTKFDKNLTGPANNSVRTKINIRSRNQENFDRSFSCPPNTARQQGMAERRIRLQNSKRVERSYKRVSYINMIQLDSSRTAEVSYFLYLLE